MFALQKSNKKASSRRQIAIKGVQDNILLLPGGQYRAVLCVSAVNFELKSEAEQDALLETYQSFLHSLGCPVQILIRIREMDMDKYIGRFQERMANETETVYKQELQNYTQFVQSLVATNKIMARQFYVVIPVQGKDNDVDTVAEQLALHVDIVSKGLSRLGMHSTQLTNLELLDLFYEFYNPGLSKRQPLTEQTLTFMSGRYV